MSSGSVLDAAAGDAERSFELYRELLQVPSVWGDARELRRAADLLGGALSDAGLDVQLPDSGTPEMPMLLARLPGRGAGRRCCSPATWRSIRHRNRGRSTRGPPRSVMAACYGQGAADMKGGTAGMCAAAAVLGRSGAELPGDLVVLAVPNHFEGGEGTRKAVREGLRTDAAIVCEPTDLEVVTGQRGILYLEITVRGRAAHTTALRLGVNAIERAARVVAALGAMTDARCSRGPGRRRTDGERGHGGGRPRSQPRARALQAGPWTSVSLPSRLPTTSYATCERP